MSKHIISKSKGVSYKTLYDQCHEKLEDTTKRYVAADKEKQRLQKEVVRLEHALGRMAIDKIRIVIEKEEQENGQEDNGK